MAQNDAIVAGIAVVVLLALIIASFIRIVFSQSRVTGRLDPNFYGAVPLLEDDFLGALYGLNRNDIEELMSEVKKWECGVCEFANIPESQCCVLCESPSGLTVTEESDEPMTRKEWVRSVNEFGEPYWRKATEHACQAQSNCFVVTTTLPTVREEDLYVKYEHEIEVVIDQNDSISARQETLNQPVSESATKDVEETLEMRMSLDDEREAVSTNVSLKIELAILPLDMKSAGRTLMATAIPGWLIQEIERLTCESFSIKYSALLSLLKTNMDYGRYTRLKVYRDQLYEESIELMNHLGPKHLCTRTRIELIGEMGVDAGGLQREWYTILTQAVFEPSSGLFITTDSYGYTINPQSTTPQHLHLYRAVGRLLARSILDEQVLPFHFSVPLFKMILGTPISILDMLYMDKQIYSSLQYVATCDAVEDLSLDFSIALPSGQVIELVPNGQMIMVTSENQLQYVERMLHYLLFDRIKTQLQSLLTGLFEILPQHYLMMFDHKELELVLCGITEIDMNDWRQFTATSYKLRAGAEHEEKIEWFWDILTHMSIQDRCKFLQFATGSSRVPVQGFKGLTSYDGYLCPFSVKAITYVKGILPRAHSCFNRIDLPLYPTKELMATALETLVRMDLSEFTLAYFCLLKLLSLMQWKRYVILFAALIAAVNGAGCCNNDCSGKGKCTIVGNGCICQCFKGFAGADCSKREVSFNHEDSSCTLGACPVGKAWSSTAIGVDQSHLLTVCSNRGTCEESTGTCQCDLGFTGSACDRLACPSGCSNRGECRSIKYQATQKDKGFPPPVVYNQNWDSDMVYGCLCKDGFTGPDCSQRRCPSGDDPLTGFAGDAIYGQQFNEKQSIQCSATGGTFTLSFRGQTTVPINYNDQVDTMTSKLNAISTITQVIVLYSSSSSTACPPTGNVIIIEFVQDFGGLPLLVGDASKLVYTNVGGSVTLTVSRLQAGTKENAPCSNRGTCDLTSGVCTCYDGYTTSDGKGALGTRGDCGGVIGSITACPGLVTCSGHGYCTGSPQYACMCFNGWASGDCSVRTCPKGPAWFDMASQNNAAHQYEVCSNAGTCDIATGACNCAPGFEGSACQRMKCPGIGDPPCSGRGQCLTQSRMALMSTTNGDPTPFLYGSIPNNPATWDFDKIQGCLCDPGFEGHDCSLRSCPKGDNPRTTGQANEIQTITCTATSAATFQLTFRGATTPLIDTSATSDQLTSALQRMPTLSSARVTYSVGTTVCTSSGAANIVSILFLSEMGDVPPLRVQGIDTSKITSFVINTDGVGSSVRGTTENIECSGSGICDRVKGQCLCFTEYSSSATGNTPGLREDCGSIRRTPV